MSHRQLIYDSGTDVDNSTEESDDETIDHTLVNLKQPRGCRPPLTAACCCHVCYVCQFLIFMVVFPLWTKWLVTNPMPTQYWHEQYPKWPSIAAVGGQKLAEESPVKYPIEMSPIPQQPDSCNYTCSSWRGYRTNEMNFRVSLTLNDSELAKGYVHTVYPVLLASADFNDWWVVADRRHAYPQPFWRARTSKAGHAYTYTSDTCIVPPATPNAISETTSGQFILACVVWSPTSFAELEQMAELEDSDLGSHCHSAGGVCGWTCDSVINSDLLEGCTADSTIEMTKSSIAGREIPTADFQGSIEMRECLNGGLDGTCDTATSKFKQWNCHKCLYDPRTEDDMRRRLQIPGMGGLPSGLPGLDPDPDASSGGIPGMPGIPGLGPIGTETSAAAGQGPMIYTSLPRFHVTVSGSSAPDGTDVFSQPRVFILQSSRENRGKWTKLYKHNYGMTNPPVAVGKDNKPLVKKDDDSYDEEMEPVQDPASAHAMNLNQQNRLEIDPGWCYGRQGPLYLVACAVNSTLYEGSFSRFEAGQQAAPPPFNDRCVAVSGRCAFACQSEQRPMANCTEDGYINQTALVGFVDYEKNQTAPVWLFCYVLLIGFGVKAVMLCPGVFSPYPHFRRYDPELTANLRYITVCIPSAGENKCVVLRNVVGAIGCMPKDCRCRYHVTFVDEGHRNEQKIMFQKLAAVIDRIPNFGGVTYEENVSKFFQTWVEETKKMDLAKVKDGAKGEDVEPQYMVRMCGKSSLKKLRTEGGWGSMPPASLEPLEQALTILEEDLKSKKEEKKDMHRDDVADWEPKDRNSLALRMHYLARAKPIEDERTIKAQHVAPGTWYYKVPVNAENKDWLKLRANAKEMVYGMEDDDAFMNNVPLRTSRGKAGGLNFSENYLCLYADRPENMYNDERDNYPCLYSICDARHQFQTDFFHTTIPYFFDDDMELNPYVGFTQCPQFFHEMQDKLDYLDNNNAQFFRLNCMIRNCCGGVSSCGTNGTWMIRHPPGDLVWEKERRRVRDVESKRKSQEYVERRTFHESCKVEDTASSLQQVLRGRRSQFINRRLSFGMAKNPVDYLAAVQRWAEGGVVLSLQTFFSCHKGVYMVWFTLIFFFCFLASLFRMIGKTDPTWAVVRWGLVDQESYDQMINPVVEKLKSLALVAKSEYFKQNPELLETYLTMTLQFISWVLSLCAFLLLVFLFTELLKLIQRTCGLKLPVIWPDEMRWWGRLLISMDNLTYFLWFWTAFFWIGFNYYSIFAKRTYHFSSTGMFSFMLIVQILSWGMIIASSLRYTLSTSMEANEVIGLSMDNIWRSTQLFYISAPLLLYSIIKGVQDYMRYQMYGEDISYWVGGDRGVMSKNLVKYWTLLLILGAIGAWIYYLIEGRKHMGVLSAVIIVSLTLVLIALDVLHPCTYLWVEKTKLKPAQAAKLTWSQALVTRGWWELMISNLILNETVTGLMKWLGPAWFVLMPFLTLFMPYIGVNQAFMMIGSTTNR